MPAVISAIVAEILPMKRIFALYDEGMITRKWLQFYGA